MTDFERLLGYFKNEDLQIRYHDEYKAIILKEFNLGFEFDIVGNYICSFKTPKTPHN